MPTYNSVVSEGGASGLNVACIVLAAGSSSRFGSNKLRHRLPSGQTVIEQTIAQYLKVFSEITLLVRYADSELKQVFGSSRINVVTSAHADQGMSQSLIEGVRANSNADAWMIALGDMPYLKETTIVALKNASSPDSIVQPIYLARPGNPVAFGRDFYSELIAVEGDKGGRHLIQKHQSQLIKIEVDDPGIHLDIDRPSDVLP